MAAAVEMGIQQSHDDVWPLVGAQQKKNNFKLRGNFNNSELGALNFIIDNSSIIHRQGVGGAISPMLSSSIKQGDSL
jgi:hypothetical protein